MKDKELHTIQKVWINLCCFALARVFIFSGFVETVDPLGSEHKIQDYLDAFGMGTWLPTFFPLLAGIVLSAVEFSVGVFLFFGIRKTTATWLVLLLITCMTLLTLYLALANPISDCSCFGDVWVLTNWQTFWKNVILLIATTSVLRQKHQMIRFISAKMEWLVSLYTFLFVFALSFYCLGNLPILDLRPYKIGKNIPENMSIPAGAESTVYESVFVLEENGEKKEFSLENYPDSTWKFIETRTIVRKKGYEPSVHDLSMTNLETGEDIIDKVLADKDYTLLLIAHRIEEADDSNTDLMNEIYDYAVEHGYGFYCLTSSLDYQIEQWKGKTGAEYPFCLMDDITLKTMTRSNPGLMLIKEGTILNRWSDNESPDEYALTDRLEDLELGKQRQEGDVYMIGYVLLWSTIPLLMALGVDILVVKRLEKKRKEAADKAAGDSQVSSETQKNE